MLMIWKIPGYPGSEIFQGKVSIYWMIRKIGGLGFLINWILSLRKYFGSKPIFYLTKTLPYTFEHLIVLKLGEKKIELHLE